jgi:putative membrane protein
MWYMFDGGWWVLGGFLMIVFWGAIIALIIWGITQLVRNTGTGTKRTPLDVAKERYAKGEISQEEFEQIKKDLV